MDKLLIVGSGDISFRGYILREIKQYGIKIILVSEEKVSWEKDFVDEYYECSLAKENLHNVVEMLSKVQANGILTYVESLVEVTAFLAKALNLKFISEKKAHRARDKNLMRKYFKRADMNVPKFKKCADFDEIKKEFKKFKVPCVVKPIDGFSSINIIKIETEKDFKILDCLSQQDMLGFGIKPQYLIEEYIGGEEISVEGILDGSNFIKLGITEKFKSDEPYFEELGQLEPLHLDSKLEDSIITEVIKGIRALGLENCAIHAELKIKNGCPYVIEIGARLGGDKIPFLVEKVTGISMAVLSAKIALGEKIQIPEHLEITSQYAMIGFFIPKKMGIIKRLPSTKIVSDLKNKTIEFEFWAEIGERIILPPVKFFTRLGYAIVCDSSRDKAISKLDSIITEVEKEIGVELFKLDKQR